MQSKFYRIVRNQLQNGNWLHNDNKQNDLYCYNWNLTGVTINLHYFKINKKLFVLFQGNNENNFKLE